MIDINEIEGLREYFKELAKKNKHKMPSETKYELIADIMSQIKSFSDGKLGDVYVDFKDSIGVAFVNWKTSYIDFNNKRLQQFIGILQNADSMTIEGDDDDILISIAIDNIFE